MDLTLKIKMANRSNLFLTSHRFISNALYYILWENETIITVFSASRAVVSGWMCKVERSGTLSFIP